MADLVSDGKLRITWVTTISNPAAPTVAELNAGTRLDTTMTEDGLDRSWDTADVPNARISSTQNTTDVGRRTCTVSVTLYRQTGTDTIFNLLAYTTAGYLVIRDNIDAGTANAASQIVDVHPAKCGQANKLYGPNTEQRYTVPLKSTSDAYLNSVVAA